MKFPDHLLHRCAGAQSVVAFTGAGVSAESGVPTFRGNDGIWGKFKPEELANVSAFMKNPALVWQWYADRRRIMNSIGPNPGHVALAAMEERFERFTVVTQNIDNLHRRAGSRNVVELHGNIERNYCMTCGKQYRAVEVQLEEGIPRCSHPVRPGRCCDGLIRPDVVWFGEILPEDEWNAGAAACTSADIILSIGTSGVVYPAASLPMMGKEAGAYVVEINPEPTSLTSVADCYLQGLSGKILPRLLERIQAVSASGGS